MRIQNVLKVIAILAVALTFSNGIAAQCVGGLEVSLFSGETELTRCPDEIADLDIQRFRTGRVPTPVAFLVTDEENNIIQVSRRGSIDLTGLGEGTFRVWAFSYAGQVTAEAGANAAEIELASICGVLSANFVTVTNLADGDCFRLQVLHNNDAESQLVNAGSGIEEFGGAAQFKTVVDELRAEAAAEGRANVTVTSGDNFIPSPEFNASLALEEDEDLYDAVLINAVGYDALCLGNHDFDFGPDILARLIEDVNEPTEFLSANLDFSNEPPLQELVEAGRIAPSTIVEKNGEQIGIIGLTTPNLPFIASPRNVEVSDDLVNIVQGEVDAMEAAGVNKIILISHLQSINEELELAAALSGVDIFVAGGGDEFLTNDPASGVPGDMPSGPYPLVTTDADGNEVYVVTTPGELRYVGNLMVTFNPDGKIVFIDGDSNPVTVRGFAPDADLLASVAEPVSEFVAGLAQNIIATTEVALDGLRSSVRTMETNQGNLIADALRWQASELAASFGVPVPDVGLQNGGGIRNNTVIAAGSDLSELTTFDILPFANFVTVIEPLPASQFKEIMENAVSRVENVSGRFAQVSGCTVVYDPDATAQVLDDDANVEVAGERIVSITLDDGTPIVADGEVVPGAPDITIATIDFLARGGDQYPYRGADFEPLGVSYQQALANYLEFIGGVVTAADYPEGGEGRITTVGSMNSFNPTLPQTELAAPVKGNGAFELTVFPNPVNDVFTLSYSLEADQNVELMLTTLDGRTVTQLFDGKQTQGEHRQVVDLTRFQLAAGQYLLTLRNGETLDQVTLVKQ